jgi:hypothetical protein
VAFLSEVIQTVLAKKIQGNSLIYRSKGIYLSHSVGALVRAATAAAIRFSHQPSPLCCASPLQPLIFKYTILMRRDLPNSHHTGDSGTLKTSIEENFRVLFFENLC